MTLEKRLEITDNIFSDIKHMTETKGVAYAGEDDILSNFKRNAERLGMTKYQVWAIYFNKHIDAINNAIKERPETAMEKTEGLSGRILDSIVYLIILACLQFEDEQQSKVKIEPRN